jgi:hypothetical protein
MALLTFPVIAAAGEEPLVARAWLRGAAEPGGAVFFLPVATPPGAVAVGAARTFDRTSLAESGEVVFRSAEGREVARSTRLYTRIGRPFYEAGATAADDYTVLALEAAPEGVRVLEPAAGLPTPGERVRLLGLPTEGPPAAAIALAGSVVRAEAGELTVDLDAPAQLRGWGGAPVLDAEGRVIGLLQSARPGAGSGPRLGVGPIQGVVTALADPYEGGLGRLFATVAPHASAANSLAHRGRIDPRDEDASLYAAARVGAATRGLSSAEDPRTLLLAVDQPMADAEVGDVPTVFVAGHAVESRGGTRRFDLVVVIDTSESTALPAGVDVDGDGLVGVPLGPNQAGSSDPDDSILAAEVAAAKALVAGLDPQGTRVGVVSFAGMAEQTRSGTARIERAAVTREPLTSDPRRLRRALDDVRAEGAAGMTHMAAGIDLATLELLGLEGALSRHDPGSEKAMLVFTDGEPTLPDFHSMATNVRAVLAAAGRARRAGVRIDSFAIGPEALGGPLPVVEMAAITDGLFTPVRHPGKLVRSMSLVSFARVETLELRNLTTKQAAYELRLHADGSWNALVPVAPGRNELEVWARGVDGAEARQRLAVTRTTGREPPPLPAELLPRKNALLAARLEALDAERAERVRRELIIEIQTEREAARRRATRQRKELRIEVLPPGEADRRAAESAPTEPSPESRQPD